MEHLPSIISDLGLILITAAVVTLIFRQLKQPLVLGYILAGFIVSPYFSFTPNVTDEHNINIWGEIGVIFLLFSLGLEFSFKKLLKEGGTTILTAIIKIFLMLIAGFGVGMMLGWGTMNSLFLGSMLSVSSTMIVLKAFEEYNLKSRNFARIVLGVLIVEDIVVVLLMVLLSTISETQKVAGGEMIFTIAKLGFFLILWFLMGIFIIPTLLKKVKKLLNDEVYLVLSIGLCLGMVWLATVVGFSAELGAFIMGSILAETTSAEKIEHQMHPVKNLFGAIFFVSIGMMINPVLIWQYKWVILLIVALTIVGKFVFTLAGALLSGQKLKQSVQVGMSMAQISEFAFIVATLGMTLKVISDFLFPIAVGAAVITTFTTPYMIKYADNMYNFIEKIMPEKWLKYIEAYSSRAENPKAETETKKWLKNVSIIVLINGILIFSILMLCGAFLLPALEKAIGGILPEIITLVVGLLLASPFIWALIFKMPYNITGAEMLKSGNYNRKMLIFVEIFRLILGMAFIGILADKCFGTKIAVFAVIPASIFLLIIFSKQLKFIYKILEKRFMLNFHGREIAANEQQAPMSNIKQRLKRRNPDLSDDWDLHLADLIVPQHAEYIGRTLKELQWREKFDISVVYIKRGEEILYAPGPNNKLMPFDHVGVFATDEVLEKFRPAFETEHKMPAANYEIEDIIVEKFYIDDDSALLGKSIRNSGIRETTGGMVLAFEHKGKLTLSPSPDIEFQEGDIVWVVGERKRIKGLEKI